MINTIPVRHIMEFQNDRLSLPEIESLAASMKRIGLIEPIVVRMNSAKSYELIAGHRRLAAAKVLEWDEIPAFAVDTNTTDDTLRLAENVTRENLTPIETALAIGRMIKAKRKQKDLAIELGRSTAWVSKYATIGKALPNKITEELLSITDGDKLYAWALKQKEPAKAKLAQDEINEITTSDKAATEIEQMIADKYGLLLNDVKLSAKETKNNNTIYTVSLKFSTSYKLEKFTGKH